ncbi:MAG TPA: hypothetical protein VLJ42_08800 [Solirubrobacteraceae bacterium]|nr:hypothetical protein [Solirubrobacteraceae bacterium]
MAQTKRKRQTKHRGNAAGMVESRGRTGRKPTAAERKGQMGKAARAEERLPRSDRPPTWRGAFYRAMFAAVGLLLIGIFLLKNSQQAIAYFPIVLLAYVPISYYTDLWLYRRRMRSKAKSADKGRAASK